MQLILLIGGVLTFVVNLFFGLVGALWFAFFFFIVIPALFIGAVGGWDK